jgi:6-phosphofructokinase 1
MSKHNRIGVLTSGGDAPGMNAAIRAVVRTCSRNGVKALGIRRGWNGLIHGDVVELKATDVNGLTLRGGTMLYTARCPEFKTEEGLNKAVASCKYLGLDGIVAIGGDGTFRGAHDLSRRGVACIGVPATIDNDIACTEYSIGFDTACNTALDAIDKLRDTSQSHERCSIVEVMGRHAGHLALYVGIAAGAVTVLVPERPVDLEDNVIEVIRNGRVKGITHFLVIVAEGASAHHGGINELANAIHLEVGIDTRVSILGHVQRGGSPSVRDRVAASQMGQMAAELLIAGKSQRIVAERGYEFVDIDIAEAFAMTRDLDESMYRSALILSLV